MEPYLSAPTTFFQAAQGL